jgi:ankyrin repeat protein
MEPPWPRLERKTVFVSCSTDMAAEAERVRNVFDELNRRLPKGDRWEFYRHTDADKTYSATGTWQEYIPRASDPNARVVICLLGERIGSTLPDDFPLPAELSLPDGVEFRRQRRDHAASVPLTGTSFELIDATRRSESGREVLCYIKADLKRFAADGLTPRERRYGYGHHYRALAGGNTRIQEEEQEKAYDEQIRLLDRFCDVIFRIEKRPYTCFGGEGASVDECLADLDKRLRQDLPRLLRAPEATRAARDLKGLAAYQPDDWDILFGRNAPIESVLNRLENLHESPIVTLTGRRGEGKSSVLRAGLIGRLQHHPDLTADLRAFHPVLCDSQSLGTTEPLTRLSESINGALTGTLWSGQHHLADFVPSERIHKLVEGVRAALRVSPKNAAGKKARLFIGLDQIEELLVAAENPAVRAATIELLSAVRRLAEEDLAWVVVAVPTDQRDLIRRVCPDWPLEIEDLEGDSPVGRDLHAIVQSSFVKARFSATAEEIDDIVKQATAWIKRQEDAGPVLPLLSALMLEMVRARRDALRRQLTQADPPNAEPPITLESILDLLGERAWIEAGMDRGVTADEDLARLLRQLVLTGFNAGSDLKQLRPCPVDHPAAVRASTLVAALARHRFLFRPDPQVLRLVHVAIVDHWKRAAAWYDKDKVNQKTLVKIGLKLQTAEDGGSAVRLITEPHELDEIEDLLLAWYDDQDQLAHSLDLVRASLMEAFDPVLRPESWRRHDGGSRLCAAMGINDPALVAHCLGRLAAMDEAARLEAVRFVTPVPQFHAESAVHFAVWRGNFDALRRLSELGAELDRPSALGQSPLWLAASAGFAEVASFLIDQGAVVDQADPGDMTPMIAAAWHSQESAVRLLLDRGADVHRRVADGSTALALTAMHGDQALVRLLLDVGSDVNNVTAASWTPLTLAASHGHEGVVRLLIDRGAHVNLAAASSESALLLAAKGGHVGVARLLIDRGASVDAATVEGGTALMMAAAYGHDSIVRLLLEHGVAVDGASPNFGTSLIMAVHKGHEAVVKTLIDHGADVNLARADSGTALMFASDGGHDRVAALLLEKGARVDCEFTDGRTALDWAAQGGHEPTVRLLLDHGASVAHVSLGGLTALATAAIGGHEDVVVLLLDRGADLHQRMPNGVTAAMAAAQAGHASILRSLLDRGADIEAATDDGRTVLLIAAQHGKEAATQLLVERGADINRTTGAGFTALALAIASGVAPLVAFLLDHGVEVDGASPNVDTPLIMAVDKGHEAVVKTLIDHGADVNLARADSGTALMFASGGGHDRVAALLLEKGARVDCEFTDGRTALDWAAQGGHESTVRLLLDHGASITHVTLEGLTALGAATIGGHEDVVALLLDRGADLHQRRPDGETAAILAAQAGHASILGSLLDRGADIEAATDDGRTVLLIAAHHGKEAATRLLVERGADINHITDAGFTALALAIASGVAPLVAFLLDHGATLTNEPLDVARVATIAAESGREAVVQLMLDRGVPVDAAFGDGRTMLTVAAEAGHENVVRLLIDRGADPTGDMGALALSATAFSGHEAVVRLLLDRGARVDVDRHLAEYTALMNASLIGHAGIVRRLLEAGAEVDRTNATGTSSLMAASGHGHQPVVNFLLDHGAQVNLTTKNGTTALIRAASMGHDAVARFLIARGADVEARAADGATPLIVAATDGHDAVVRALLDAGACRYSVTRARMSPLVAAAGNGHLQVVKMLLAHRIEGAHTTDRTHITPQSTAKLIIKRRERSAAIDLARANGHDEVAKLLSENFRRYRYPSRLAAIPRWHS